LRLQKRRRQQGGIRQQFAKLLRRGHVTIAMNPLRRGKAKPSLSFSSISEISTSASPL
jgi:hypothetical protein